MFAVVADPMGKMPRPNSNQSFALELAPGPNRSRRTRCMTRMTAARMAVVSESHPIHPIPPPAVMSPSFASKIDAALLAALLVLLSRTSAAEPLRLRGDALVQTPSPVGLLILRGEDRLK